MMFKLNTDTAQGIDNTISRMNAVVRTAYQATFSTQNGYYIPLRQFLDAVGITQAELDAFMMKYRERKSLNYPSWSISVGTKMRDFWDPSAPTPMMVSISEPNSR